LLIAKPTGVPTNFFGSQWTPFPILGTTASNLGSEIIDLNMNGTIRYGIGTENNVVRIFSAGINYNLTVLPDLSPAVAPPLNESFVVFSSVYENVTLTRGDVRSAQTTQMIGALNEFSANVITPNQAILFVMTQKSTQLPIRYFKLYYDGFMTASSTAIENVFTFSAYDITPVSIIQATDAIPTNSTLRTNELMLRAANCL